MAKNQGRFDGLPIEIYEGRFAGGFEMDQEIGESIAYDDVVTFLVVAVAGKANIDATKSGDLKRTNYFDVESVSIVPPESATQVINEIGALVDGVNAGQLKLGQNPTESWADEEIVVETDVYPTISAADPALSSFLDAPAEAF